MKCEMRDDWNDRGSFRGHSMVLNPIPNASLPMMVVGTLEVRLLVRESRTLKDKRQVVR